jgi:glycerol-3-phosphate cytidylyltransferase
MKTVITYGTFDLFHIGHLNLFRSLKSIGDRLIVAVSTDEFNETKGKRAIIPFGSRVEIVQAIRFVDLVVPENSWEQKVSDIKEHKVDIFAIGDDWAGKFDHLSEYCEVVYLPRTHGISSTGLRQALAPLRRERIDELRSAIDILSRVVEDLD